MNKTIVMDLALSLLALPFAFAVAAQPEQPADVGRNPRIMLIDKNDIPLEDLAHVFLFNTASPENLKGIISEAGINLLEPELAEQSRELTDLRRIAPKVRHMCNALQNAKNGQEFAEVFIAADEEDQREKRASAKRIFSKLDANDREALERYLDTSFRQGAGRGKVDYEAMFASSTFPSTESKLITQRTCDTASEMEMSVKP